MYNSTKLLLRLICAGGYIWASIISDFLILDAWAHDACTCILYPVQAYWLWHKSGGCWVQCTHLHERLELTERDLLVIVLVNVFPKRTPDIIR